MSGSTQTRYPFKQSKLAQKKRQQIKFFDSAEWAIKHSKNKNINNDHNQEQKSIPITDFLSENNVNQTEIPSSLSL